MNEHDSERIAGLLAAQGMVAADSLDDADVVVLNTCCIRENADNKLYGHLGRLKALKAARPDLQIAVGGCLAQKDRELITRARRARRRRVRHAQPCPRTRAPGPGPRTEGPLVEILEEHEAYPTALPARREVDHAAWITIQIGCDNSCAFCIVPSVRGREVSRRMGDIVHEVRDARGRRRASRSRCSDRTSTRTGATSAPGSTGPSSPTCSARSTRSTASSGSASRHRIPKDLRPETIAAMAECEPCASTSTCRCSRGATGCWRACTAATPRPATSSGSPRPVPRFPTSRSPPTSSSASPARPRPTSKPRSTSPARPVTTPPTPSCSRPGPAPRPRAMTDEFVDPDVSRDRMERLVAVVGAQRSAHPRGPGGSGGRGARRRAVEEGRARVGGPHAGTTSSRTSPSRRRGRGRRGRRRDHPRRAALAAG